MAHAPDARLHSRLHVKRVCVLAFILAAAPRRPAPHARHAEPRRRTRRGTRQLRGDEPPACRAQLCPFTQTRRDELLAPAAVDGPCHGRAVVASHSGNQSSGASGECGEHVVPRSTSERAGQVTQQQRNQHVPSPLHLPRLCDIRHSFLHCALCTHTFVHRSSTSMLALPIRKLGLHTVYIF